MPTFCVDKHEPAGVHGHLVHNVDAHQQCLPASYFQLPLGSYADRSAALYEALEFYKDAHLCPCCWAKQDAQPTPT